MTYEEAMDRCVIIRDTLLGRDLTITSNADNIEWATMCADGICKSTDENPCAIDIAIECIEMMCNR